MSHIDRTPVDVDLALSQWSNYCDAFRQAGWEVVELPTHDEHPDAVFIEDDVFVLGDLAIIARPAAASRRREIDGLDAVFRDLGFEVAAIEAPGTLEGGDLLKVASSVYAGRSARTDDEGIGPRGRSRRQPDTDGCELPRVDSTDRRSRISDFEPIAVDIGEFEKLEGCVTCLSVRLHDGVD